MIVLQTMAVAFAMFSALPVPQFTWNSKNMRYALCAFPLIGLVMRRRCGASAAALPLPDMTRAGGVLPHSGGWSPAASIWTAMPTLRTPFPAMATGKRSWKF